MIQTGLPYAFDQMEEIAKNGAVVDMSDLAFPGIKGLEASVRTAFIFLRNTGFPVMADYSKCSYDMKEAYLVGYLEDGIESQQDKLASTWLAACFKYLEIDQPQESILEEEELLRFCSEHMELLKEVVRYTKSVPLFLMAISSLNGSAFTLDGVEHISGKPMTNAENVFFADELGLVAAHEDDMTPAYYDDAFTEKNHKFVERLCQSDLFTAMNGLALGKPSEWKSLMAYRG